MASFAIPNLQRAVFEADTATVRKIIRTAAEAVEIYASENGDYPTNITSLTNVAPPYLSDEYHDYCLTLADDSSGYIHQGFVLGCTFENFARKYKITAFVPDGGKGSTKHTSIAPSMHMAFEDGMAYTESNIP